jgi:hypothetical protein
MDWDPHLVFMLDPDPHKTNADPKHCSPPPLYGRISPHKLAQAVKKGACTGNEAKVFFE